MAHEEVLTSITLQAAADLSAYQYCAVCFTTLGYVTATTGPLSSGIIGILQDKSTAAGYAVKVGIDGVSKVFAGNTSAHESTIAFGGILVPSSGSLGRLVAATATGQDVVAIALEMLTSGYQGLISARLVPGQMLSS